MSDASKVKRKKREKGEKGEKEARVDDRWWPNPLVYLGEQTLGL